MKICKECNKYLSDENSVMVTVHETEEDLYFCKKCFDEFMYYFNAPIKLSKITY